MAALNDPRSRAHTVLLACAGAVAVRAFMFCFVDARFDTGDGSSYLQSARTLLQEGTFSYDSVAPFTPSAYRPPLFPVHLAGLLVLTRNRLMAARVAHAGERAQRGSCLDADVPVDSAESKGGCVAHCAQPVRRGVRRRLFFRKHQLRCRTRFSDTICSGIYSASP